MKKMIGCISFFLIFINSFVYAGELAGNKLFDCCLEAERFLQGNNGSTASKTTIQCLSMIDGFKDGIIASHWLYDLDGKAKKREFVSLQELQPFS